MTITYDNIGNPITIGNATLTWKNGKELASYRVTGLNVNYNYNVDGIRIGKTVNNVRTDYLLENNLIILEKTGNNVLYYIRDNKGDAVGFVYNNIKYYYKKNFEGDVIGIYDSNYNIIVNYKYDDWGKLISITDNNGDEIIDNTSIGYINPLRYRSYYYDSETGLYYLNSRYYNPDWGRFINADNVFMCISDYSNSLNLYIYCNNNPVIYSDINAKWPTWNDIKKAVKKTVKKIVNVAKKVLERVDVVVSGGHGFGLGGSKTPANVYSDEDTTYELHLSNMEITKTDTYKNEFGLSLADFEYSTT